MPAAQQPGKFGNEIRPGAAEALDDGVRGRSHVAVLARCNVCKEFKNSRVCFLDVVHEEKLQPLTFSGQEVGRVLEDLPGGGDDSGGVKGLGHAEVQHVPVFGIERRGGDPVLPAAAAAKVFKVFSRPARFDDPVEQLADLVPESPGLQRGSQVSGPWQLQAGKCMALQQLLDNEVLLGSGQEARRPWKRQDAFSLGPPDKVEGIGGPGPCRGGAQAPVQPGREAVPKRVGGQPARGKDQDPLRVHAVVEGPAHGGFDQDGGLAGPGRTRNEDRSGTVRDLDGVPLVS